MPISVWMVTCFVFGQGALLVASAVMTALFDQRPIGPVSCCGVYCLPVVILQCRALVGSAAAARGVALLLVPQLLLSVVALVIHLLAMLRVEIGVKVMPGAAPVVAIGMLGAASTILVMRRWANRLSSEQHAGAADAATLPETDEP
ncbi:hypothetical protein [Planctomycetes bacterium Pan216]|uniref:hypothetical protein n=1 Tax=Kolteria novifilia TaxID=2527975 RepID=UPI0011AB1829